VLATEPDLPRITDHPHQTITPQDSQRHSPPAAASGGYLARPSNIYAEEPVTTERQSNPEHSTTMKEPIPHTVASDPSREEDASPDMQLVYKDTEPAADEPGAHQTHLISVANGPAEEPARQDDADDPKRRAAERINKLRNLSFNINAADPNNEFETVPAYIRRNLELYNTISNVENFYSNYEVKTDENNNTEISTINTFLDGKRPD
jgi:cell division protein FtsZ